MAGALSIQRGGGTGQQAGATLRRPLFKACSEVVALNVLVISEPGAHVFLLRWALQMVWVVLRDRPSPARPTGLANPSSFDLSFSSPSTGSPISCTNFNIDNSNNMANDDRTSYPAGQALIWVVCVDSPISSSQRAFDQLSGWMLVVGRWVG